MGGKQKGTNGHTWKNKIISLNCLSLCRSYMGVLTLVAEHLSIEAQGKLIPTLFLHS